MVEPTCNRSRELEVGQLILALLRDIGLAKKDIRSLVHRVCIHVRINACQARGLNLFLYRGVSIELRHCYKGEKRQGS